MGTKKEFKRSFDVKLSLNVSDRQKENFEESVKMLKATHAAIVINEAYKNLGSKDRINIEILYKAVGACLTREPFSGRDLIDFYSARIQVEKFNDAIQPFEGYVEAYPFLRSEMMLMGLEDKFDAANDAKKNMIMDQMFHCVCDVTRQEMLLGELFAKIKNLVEVELP